MLVVVVVEFGKMLVELDSEKYVSLSMNVVSSVILYLTILWLRFHLVLDIID